VGAYVVTGQRARQMRVVPAEVLKRLYARSDWYGFVQTAGHLALLIAGGWLVLATLGTWWVVPALLLQGLFVNALFGAMHESVHYGSFKTRWAADLLAFFSGAAILNNAGFYRHYHLAHHRYTQDPARDPELVTSGTPRTWGQYLFRVSSIPFLMLRMRDIFLFPFGYRGNVDYIHPSAWPEAQRWGRWLLALYGALIAVFGLALIPYILISAVFGFTLLETVNYLEHYGLLRQKRESGRYERCAPSHSWNSDHIVTNLFLYHLQRHSDHHANPTRRYQTLRSMQDAPNLPSGYASMIALTYVPAVWRRVMDHRVLDHYDGDVTRVNLHPRVRDKMLARYGAVA